MHELVTLCAAAMRPSENTWKRFLAHLNKLHTAQHLSEDQVGTIIASAVADHALRDAEMANDDGEDFDSGTLDEVIERVSSDYSAEADNRVRAISEEYEQRLAREEIEANERLRAARLAADVSTDELRRRDKESERRAQWIATWTVGVSYWLLSLVVVLGAAALILNYAFTRGWIGVISGGAVLLLALLELFGVLHHLHSIRYRVRERLKRRLANWLRGNGSWTPPPID